MSDRKPTARGGPCRPRMTGGSVQMEDRNMLRRMERERRSLEVQQEESQYDRITPLFSEPFKRTKGDELSSLIQRMLGDYEDGCDAGPEELYSAHPYVPFPLVDVSKGSQCDSSRGAGASVCIRHEGESWDSLPVLRAPVEPLSPLQSSDSAGDASPDRSRSPRRLDVPPLTLPLNVHGKLINAKKPTAYVRPMDGQDQVSSDSPQLKASPEPRECLQDLKESSKATPLQCVDVGSHERVLDILQEMTSWPPLLTSIHTPNTAEPPKSLSTAQESPGFTAPRLSSDRVQLEPQGATSFSSDSDSSSDPDNEKGSSPAQPASAETTHTQKESDWQLARWLEERENQHQQNPGSPCDVIRPNSHDSSGGGEAAGHPGCFSSPTESSKDADGRQNVGSTFVCEDRLIKKSHVKTQHTENASTHRLIHKKNKMLCHIKQKSATTGNSIRKQTYSKRTHQPLLVKIELNLLSRVPREPKGERCRASESSGHKRAAETNENSLKKKPKLDKEGKWSASVQHSQSEAGRCSVTMMMKKSTRPRTSLPHQHRPAPDTPQMEAENHGKKSCKSNNVLEKDKAGPLLPLACRPCSVEDHMKEAKKLKHKADATPDKTAKALLYLEAVLAFVESGVAMEKEPQTPKSSYTMFSETLELIRFILKLKNYADSAAASRERDFLVLCLRCQSLLQMAMFRYRREAALRYSRTLADHFKSSSWSASPRVSRNYVTSPVTSSGLLVVPQPIQQMAAAYISITALVLSAHDTWERAEELAHAGSGLLRELDSAVGALTLTSSISALVCYTRYGLQRLRLDLH